MLRSYFLLIVFALLFSFSFSQKIKSAAEENKKTWNGFDRYDFVMDSISFEIRPFHADTSEGTGIHKQVPGKVRCLIVVPLKMAPGSPWSWRGCYWDHQPQTEIELLRRGFYIAFAGCDPGKYWDYWYQFLVSTYGLSARPAFIGMSRGGLNEYSWATVNPEKVSCIYADNPVLFPQSIQRLAELARNDVPLFHICGSFDFLLQQNTRVVENLYHQSGGRISVMIKEGLGHHPHSLQDPRLLADWMEQNSKPVRNNIPVVQGMAFIKSWYYTFDHIYKEIQKDSVIADCSGPAFFPCYERYDEEMGNQWGLTGTTIIVPNKPLPGKPWVLVANPIGREPSVFHLAFLARGFYIVSPRLLAQAGPLKTDWDSLYTRLLSAGFSAKPVLEGSAAGAGEAIAWSIVHPDRVSEIFTVNPLLRSLQTNINILHNLEPLARAAVPIICLNSLDVPLFKENEKALDQEYKKLGGKFWLVTSTTEALATLQHIY
jgi:hypothetical protein